ncbi:MAG: hypothetical protein SW833_04970 [Cyanobacteriota bacterium]|nr:hypothetical protein [Cyanobacteriota bacterium]
MDPLEQLLIEAERDLLSAPVFYARCQAMRYQRGRQRLYFYEPPASWLVGQKEIGVREWQQFFDRLALELRQPLSTQARLRSFTLGKAENPLSVNVEIVGEGMVGRVARVQIGKEIVVAFKAFFDPAFVWQHGAWAEIPIGIWLKAHGVVRDLPEFFFAGEDWAVWEWISPQTQPRDRAGIPYEQCAQQYGLTRLNPCNRQNYNPHNLRLDPGGIQKDYWGRRWRDGLFSCLFYWRKARREGLKSLVSLLQPARLSSSFGQFLGVWRWRSRPVKSSLPSPKAKIQNP